MAELTAKLKLLLDNRIKTPLSEAKKHLSKNVDEMKAKLNSLKETQMQSFQSLRNEIPMLDKGLKMLANPITLAIAGAVAVGTAFVKSTKAALDWEKSMSEINATAKLSKEELAGLSDSCLTSEDVMLHLWSRCRRHLTEFYRQDCPKTKHWKRLSRP